MAGTCSTQVGSLARTFIGQLIPVRQGLMLHILKVPGSYLEEDIGYSHWHVRWGELQLPVDQTRPIKDFKCSQQQPFPFASFQVHDTGVLTNP